MLYFIAAIILIGLFVLAYKWLEVKKAVGGTEAYAKRKAVFYLFSAFLALISITTVLLDVLCQQLGFEKPPYVEWIGLLAFGILAWAVSRMFSKAKQEGTTELAKDAKEEPPPVKTTIVTQINKEGGGIQNNQFN